LDRHGRVRAGAIETVKMWGRACIKRLPTLEGAVWVKFGYSLPPGEELILPELVKRSPAHLPRVVDTWPGAVMMEEMSGELMPEASSLEHWILAASTLAEIQLREEKHVEHWLSIGVRDRRALGFEASVHALLASPVLRGLSAQHQASLARHAPDWIVRFADAFQHAPTLVHQDAGCCNIMIDEGHLTVFDWTDVVIGHPVFSCDRLLDQVPRELKQSVIDAFVEAHGFPRAEFDAIRKANVLHEVLRYHDELAHLPGKDPCHVSLSGSVLSQLRVLIEHEAKLRGDRS
ncbi:MAG: hypothetical protein ACI841_005110, partial [Planctomycetota bacterium]